MQEIFCSTGKKSGKQNRFYRKRIFRVGLFFYLKLPCSLEWRGLAVLRARFPESRKKQGGQNMDQISPAILEEMAFPGSFARGLRYYQEGAVSSTVYDQGFLQGEVRGRDSKIFKVCLEIRPPFAAQCTCSYDGGGICQHVVALGLAWHYNSEQFQDQGEKEKNIREDLEEILGMLEKEDLIAVIIHLLGQEPDLKIKLLDFLDQRGEMPLSLQEKKLETLINRTLELFQNCRGEGGGPEGEEEKCSSFLREIGKILQSGSPVDSRYRRKIMRALLQEYPGNNSNLDNAIIEVLYAAAVNRTDWEYLIDGLQKSSRRDDQKKARLIYLHQLQEEEKYLSLLNEGLQEGTDYLELALFFQQQGQVEKAVAAARAGEEKGQGSVIDNLTFLREYYFRTGNQALLREYALKEFREKPSLEGYLWIMENCQFRAGEELKEQLENIVAGANQGNLLAAIYCQEDDDHRVRALIREGRIRPGKYEELLIRNYPREMIAYYKQAVQENINKKNRKSYARAAHLARKIRGVMEQLQDREEWELYLKNLLKQYPRHKALQEEFAHLEQG